MEAKDILTVILSSTVFTTAITVLFNYLSKKRQDSIENITKERKEWRGELRKIAKAISKATDLEHLKTSLSDLIVRINAYCVAKNSLFSDTYFWDIINDLYSEEAKSLSDEQIDGYKIVLINHISCILKFDWERSKAEIKGSTQSRIVYFALFICYVFSVIHLGYITINQTNLSVNNTLLPFSIHYILVVAYAIAVVYWADKWKSGRQLVIYLLFCLFFGVILFVLMFKNYYSIQFNQLKLFSPDPSSVSFLLMNAPFLVLIYASEVKLLLYIRNMQNFVISAVISSGQTEINKKYKIYFINFPKKYLRNRCTGQQITFSDSPSRTEQGDKDKNTPKQPQKSNSLQNSTSPKNSPSN